MRLCFKTLTFSDPLPVDPCVSSGRPSGHSFGVCHFVMEIHHTTVHWLRVYGKVQPKPCTKICCPHSVSLFLGQWVGHHVDACRVFCPQTVHATSPKCTPAEVLFFSCATQGILSLHCPLQSIHHTTKLSMRETGSDLQNFRICTPPLLKTCSGQPLSFSQSMVLGKSSSYYEIPWVCLHFFSPPTSISLSLSSLCDQGSLPSSSFLPHIKSLQLLPSTVWSLF